MNEDLKYVKKLYVRTFYIPPKNPQPPLDCSKVRIVKSPEIIFSAPHKSDERGQKMTITHPGNPMACIAYVRGIALVGATPTTEGAGGVRLYLQIWCHISWEVAFVGTMGRLITETHQIYLSSPVMYKLEGPDILITAANFAAGDIRPRLIRIAGVVAKLYNALKETESVLALIAQLRTGYCPPHIEALRRSLAEYEGQMNSLLRSATTERPYDGMRASLRGHFGSNRLA